MPSMYTESYLDYVDAHHIVTPGTYLTRVLRGRAKSYKGRYLDALVRDLETRVKTGEIERAETVRGAAGYRRKQNN